MTHLQKLRTSSVLKWVSSNFLENHFKSPKTQPWLVGPIKVGENTRLYGAIRRVQTENSENLDETMSPSGHNVARISSAKRKEAQAALTEYLHSTRSLQFVDAEHISRNSPHFLQKLLKKIKLETDIHRSITRYLRYHPINEFEPFFESLGLKPSEYAPLLSHDVMFLNDDGLLLENYHVLCNYGIARDRMGKIYKGAREVFQYEFGVLRLKLQALEKLGLSQDSVRNVIICCPHLLVGDAKDEFGKVLKRLKSLGFRFTWIEQRLLEHGSCNWNLVHRILNAFRNMGCNEEQLGGLISKHPGFLFGVSGTLSIIGLLFKFGTTLDDMRSTFLQFPEIQVEIFVSNFRQCLTFLNEIEMEPDEIAKVVRVHPILLGSCTLRKTGSLLTLLNVGKKRLCQYVQENPEEMKKWVVGSKAVSFSDSGVEESQQMLRTKLLLDLGFEENSNKMEEARKAFRGRAGELQDRFDCIVKAGLDMKDVTEMVTECPHILNLTKDVIERKIDFLVNDLGYPISTLVIFPSYFFYTIKRVRLRLSMFNWLKDQGATDPMVTLSSLVTCSDKIFVGQFVNQHPKGPEVWQRLKKGIYSD